MTGRRLLDVAAIFKASRGVVSKHVVLRKHQLDAYSKTSSLAKAVKFQTDRVTLTAKAASALSERFNGPGPEYSAQASQSAAPIKDYPLPSRSSVRGAKKWLEDKEGVKQDHFYENSEENATAELVSNSDLDVNQEKAKRYSLSDGSISLAGSSIDVLEKDEESYAEFPQTEPAKNPLIEDKGAPEKILQPASSGRTSIPDPSKKLQSLSAEKAKKLQREAEKQIPSQAAEPPPAAASEPQTTATSIGDGQGLKVEQEQDVFYTPPSSSDRVLSALPRVKLPKNTEDVQGSDEHVPDDQINQDVFYSTTSETQEQAIPKAQAVPEQEQLSDNAYSELFHSPRIAEMLGGRNKQGRDSKGLDLPGAKETPVKQTKLPQETDEVSSGTRASAKVSHEDPNSPINSTASIDSTEDDVHKLAAEMSKDSEATSSDPSVVRIINYNIRKHHAD